MRKERNKEPSNRKKRNFYGVAIHLTNLTEKSIPLARAIFLHRILSAKRFSRLDVRSHYIRFIIHLNATTFLRRTAPEESSGFRFLATNVFRLHRSRAHFVVVVVVIILIGRNGPVYAFLRCNEVALPR